MGQHRGSGASSSRASDSSLGGIGSHAGSASCRGSRVGEGAAGHLQPLAQKTRTSWAQLTRDNKKPGRPRGFRQRLGAEPLAAGHGDPDQGRGTSSWPGSGSAQPGWRHCRCCPCRTCAHETDSTAALRCRGDSLGAGYRRGVVALQDVRHGSLLRWRPVWFITTSFRCRFTFGVGIPGWDELLALGHGRRNQEPLGENWGSFRGFLQAVTCGALWPRGFPRGLRWPFGSLKAGLGGYVRPREGSQSATGRTLL